MSGCARGWWSWRERSRASAIGGCRCCCGEAVDCGRAIRVLSVVDAYTRECLALEVDTSFASRRVTRVLDTIVSERGLPQAIRCDNGPELTSRHFLAWCVERQIELVHIQPGKPTQNAHVESFHARLREECLNVSWFQNL